MYNKFFNHFGFIKKMIFIISLFLVMTISGDVYAKGYNYSSFKWEDFVEKYQDYWTRSCEEEDDSDLCVEQVLKTQKKFFTKLYKMLAKYESNGYYVNDELIIATIYYGLSPDAFRDDNSFYLNWFGGDKAFDFEEEDENVVIDDEEDSTYLLDEANSIKLLIKAMVGYETTCKKTEDVLYNEEDNTPFCEGEDSNLVKNDKGEFVCERLLSTGVVSFAEKVSDTFSFFNPFAYKSSSRKRCSNIGGEYSIANQKSVSEAAYWSFLKETSYFDTKPHLAHLFKHIIDGTEYESMEELDEAMSNDQSVYDEYYEDVVEVRERIVDEIKESISLFNNDYKTEVNYHSSVVNKFYYPIGSSEIEEKNGKLYASGDPVESYIIKNYNRGSYEGIDIGVLGDTVPVIAIKAGVVSKVVTKCTEGDKKCNDGYGNMVVLTHSDGSTTTYAFLSKVVVEEGQSVGQGEIIGYTGKTGAATENSLHFEISVSSGTRVNPNIFISSSNPRPKISSLTSIQGASDKQTVCLSLRDSNISYEGIAGMMANIWFESSCRSDNLENSYENSLGLVDEVYTQMVDDGTYTNFVNDQAGYGLCQWTWWTRKEKLLAKAKSENVSISDVGMQLSFLLEELQESYTGLYNAIMTGSESADEIASTFCHEFENPRDYISCDTKRATIALEFYTYVEGGCIGE